MIKFKKVTLGVLILTLLFTTLAAPVSATSAAKEQKYTVEVKGETVTVIEQEQSDGTIVIDFTYESGKTEKLIFKTEKNGETEAQVFIDDKKEYLIQKDANGNVFLNNEKVNEAPKEVKSDDENSLQWIHMRTYYTDSTVRTDSIALTASLIATAVGGKITGAITSLASFIISRSLTQVWFKVSQYYQVNSYGYVDILQYIYTYEHSNYTNLIKKTRSTWTSY